MTGKTPGEAEREILEHAPVPPSSVSKLRSRTASARTVGKSCWSDLDVLCLTSMHKDARRRYQSVEALVRYIDHYLKSEPLEARADTFSYRLGRFVRRHRKPLSGAVAAVAIVGILSTFYALRLARARSAVLAEARRTQRIESFMLNLFDGGDAAAAPSDHLRVVTLIDRGVTNARTLANEPAVQADLYQTLGNIYRKLGKLDNANALLQSSVQEYKSVRGPDSAAEAQALVALGSLRLDQGHMDEAERLIRQGLTIDRRRLAENDPETARSLSALGHVLEERGKYSQAISILNDAVARQSAAKASPADLSNSISELATAHYYSGHFATADGLNRRALALDREFYGSIHPRVGDDLMNLGEIQHDMGNERQAEQDYREALAIKRAWHGPDHPDTGIAMSAVGQALVYQKRYDEAAGLLQTALGVQEKYYGKVHPQVAMCLNTLALLDLERGRLHEAEDEFSRMAAINRAIYGEGHFLVGVALLNLGEVYIHEKDYVRAESTLRDSLLRLKGNLPPGHQTIAIASMKLGHALLLQHRYDAAEPYLSDGYTSLMRQQHPPPARLAVVRGDLAEVYDALQKPDLAKRFRIPVSLDNAVSKSPHPSN